MVLLEGAKIVHHGDDGEEEAAGGSRQSNRRRLSGETAELLGIKPESAGDPPLGHQDRAAGACCDVEHPRPQLQQQGN